MTPINKIQLNLTFSEAAITRRGKESRRRVQRKLLLNIENIPFRFVQGDLQVLATGEPEKILVTILHKEQVTHWFNVVPNKETKILTPFNSI